MAANEAGAADDGILVIGRPHRGQLDWQFLQHYDQLAKPARWTSIAVGCTHVDHARNTIVSRALAASPDVSHILFIDDDILAPSDALLRLLAHGVPIVGGLYFDRLPPHRPIAYRRSAKWKNGYEPVWEWGPGVQEVDAIGAGFLLVERHVFERLTPPWFATRWPISEDLAFCALAQAAGFRVLLDADIRLGHLTTAIVTEADYRRHVEAEAAAQQQEQQFLAKLREQPREQRHIPVAGRPRGEGTNGEQS